MRVFTVAAAVIVLGATPLVAAEYKGAVVKKVANGKFVFEVDGKEIQISPGSIAFKAFDIDGKPLTEFGQNYRVMKPGNVVDLVTTKKRNTEYVQEIHLVKGELAEMGKARTVTSGSRGRTPRKESAASDLTSYKGALIKSVEGKNVVLS